VVDWFAIVVLITIAGFAITVKQVKNKFFYLFCDKKEINIYNFLNLDLKKVGGKWIMVKCSKCGADIPDEAGFCPGCGAPKLAEKPKPVEQPRPQPIPAPKSKGGSSLKHLADIVFSKLVIIIGIAIGALLGFIGNLIVAFGGYGWTNINVLLNSIGFGGIGLLLIGAGIVKEDYNHFVRAGMIAAGGYILVTVLASVSLLSYPLIG
jgi:hypothetical protein